MQETNLDADQIAEQIRRLNAIEPLNDAQLEELTEAALDSYPSIEALAQAIKQILEAADSVPTPHQFRAVAFGFYSPVFTGCAKCDGTGFVIRKRGLHEFAVPCRCRGQKWRQQQKRQAR